MLFPTPTLLLAGLLVFVDPSTAACDAPSLRPWTIPRFELLQAAPATPSTPPGDRAGSLALNITDYNWLLAGPVPRGNALFEATTANCSASWAAGGLQDLLYQDINCTTTPHGQWVFRLQSFYYSGDNDDQPGDPLPRDTVRTITVGFTHVQELRLPSRPARKGFEAAALLKVGGEHELEREVDALGNNRFRLRGGRAVVVNQTLFDCFGKCQDYLTNYTYPLGWGSS